MVAIRATDLGKSYGSVEALSGLSLAVDRSEIYGLLGPNGAGKTTTMRILTGQLRPDDGEATVLGVDPVAEPVEARRRVGILPEGGSPPTYLTPREYVEFVGTIRELDPERIAAGLDEWADGLGFRDVVDRLHADLSRGQRQKVMIASAFVHGPEAVFVDEPLANLDPMVQEVVKRRLAEYAAEGNALLLSTHDIDVAEELCDRVGIVADGRLVAECEPATEPDLLETFLESVSDGGPQRAPVVSFAGPPGV